MIKIAADWNAIQAEYISGQTSYRKLAEKYGVSFKTLCDHGKRDHWVELAEKAQCKCAAKTVQKTANAVSENAAIAARIKTKLLGRLEREIDTLPDSIGSETRNSITEFKRSSGKRVQKELIKAYKLRDLAAAYKDLTGDIPHDEETDRNAPIYDLLRRLNDECGV